MPSTPSHEPLADSYQGQTYREIFGRIAARIVALKKDHPELHQLSEPSQEALEACDLVYEYKVSAVHMPGKGELGKIARVPEHGGVYLAISLQPRELKGQEARFFDPTIGAMSVRIDVRSGDPSSDLGARIHSIVSAIQIQLDHDLIPRPEDLTGQTLPADLVEAIGTYYPATFYEVMAYSLPASPREGTLNLKNGKTLHWTMFLGGVIALRATAEERGIYLVPSDPHL